MGGNSADDRVTVDELIDRFGLKSLHILHSDIQGAESAMLDGSVRVLAERKVWFLFISTHSNDIHTECLAKLREFDYRILRDTNLDQTTSADGLILGCSPKVAVRYESELRHLLFSNSA